MYLYGFLVLFSEHPALFILILLKLCFRDSSSYTVTVSFILVCAGDDYSKGSSRHWLLASS